MVIKNFINISFLFLALSVNASTTTDPIRLDRADARLVESDYLISADGQMVVYRGVSSDQTTQSLYAVPTDQTSGPVTLFTTTDEFTGVLSFLISNDGNFVVYRTPQGLFSVVTSGGTPEQLSSSTGGASSRFIITNDSSRVVYSENINALYSSPIAGGSRQLLIPENFGTGDLLPDYVVSPNSLDVYFTIPVDMNGNADVFSVNITGGMPINLSSDIPGKVFANRPNVTSDGSRVTFFVDTSIDSQNNTQVYSATPDGGLINRVNRPLSSAENVFSVVLAPNNQTVLYRVSTFTSGDQAVLVAPIDGGESITISETSVGVTLCGALFTQNSEDTISCTLASGQVTFEKKSNVNGASTLLASVPTNSNSNMFKTSPNGRWLVFTNVLSSDSSDPDELFSVSLTTPQPNLTKLTGNFAGGRSLSTFFEFVGTTDNILFQTSEGANEVLTQFEISSLSGGAPFTIAPIALTNDFVAISNDTVIFSSVFLLGDGINNGLFITQIIENQEACFTVPIKTGAIVSFCL